MPMPSKVGTRATSERDATTDAYSYPIRKYADHITPLWDKQTKVDKGGSEMQRKTREFTPFGLEVHTFCARHGMTKAELAERAGIPRNTLMLVSKGRRPGHQAIPALQRAMAEIAAQAPIRRGHIG